MAKRVCVALCLLAGVVKAATPAKYEVACGSSKRANLKTCKNPGFKDRTETHEVRCCSNTKKAGWKKHNNKCPYAESDVPKCFHDKTFAEAEAICADEGARLCTAVELKNDCTIATGCGHDADLIWSSTNDVPMNTCSHWSTYGFADKFIGAPWIHHKRYNGDIFAVTMEKNAQQLKLVSALNGDASQVSIESCQYPGSYMMLKNGDIRLESSDSYPNFPKGDASFNMKDGLAGVGVSFEISTKPNYYINGMKNGDLMLSHNIPDRQGGTIASTATFSALGSHGSHPCDDGTHGCDKDEGGVCKKFAGDEDGRYHCSCRDEYECVKGCHDGDIGHTCVLTTPAPTPPPTLPPTPKPIHCYGQWTGFGQCTRACGTQGTWIKTYHYKIHAKNGGNPCMWADGETREQPCNRHMCGCGKVYCKWAKNDFNYHREQHHQSIQVFHHHEEEWGNKHHCKLSSKSKSVYPDAHIVSEGQENCRCQCHDEKIGDTNGDHTDWQDNELDEKTGKRKYELDEKEILRLPEAVVHAFHFFPGVKPMYTPPAYSWEECQEACRNIEACKTWSMYTEQSRIFGSECRLYDVKLGDPRKCDFTIPDFWTAGNFPCVAKQTAYGFQNIGQSVSLGSVEKASTTSEKTCEQLGWATTNWGDDFKHTELVCGGRPDCTKTAETYKEATNICKKQGARLCTLAETQANEAANTGCGFNQKAVWTSTPCKDSGEHYYIQLGSEKLRQQATREIEKRVHCTHESQQTSSGNNRAGSWVKTDSSQSWSPSSVAKIGGFMEIAVQCCADDAVCQAGKGHLCTSREATAKVERAAGGHWFSGRDE